MNDSLPLVTVLVTHHLDENRKYLDLCLKALRESKGVDFEAIVLADSETKPEIHDSFKLVWDRSLTNATKKIHHGIKLANPKTTYFLFLSDDVVVSQTMLAKMVNGLGDTLAIINPMCNGDLGGRFVTPLPFPQHADYEDMGNKHSELITYETNMDLVVRQDWLSFYCTLIPKKVWEMVGELDEALETRHNDVDFCYRAQALGIPSLINFGAFAFHFVSRTLSKTCLPGEQDAATQHFLKKWGRRG
jgi:hypothetical protein